MRCGFVKAVLERELRLMVRGWLLVLVLVSGERLDVFAVVRWSEGIDRRITSRWMLLCWTNKEAAAVLVM